MLDSNRAVLKANEPDGNRVVELAVVSGVIEGDLEEC